MKLLEVCGLSARIGERTILKDIHLSVDRREHVAIVGPSGSGKTSLIRCLMGLLRPAIPVAGDVRFNGISLFEQSRKELRHLRGKEISFVPQNPTNGLDPLKRLKSQWQQVSRKWGTEVPQISLQERLAKVGLPSPQLRFPHEWSRGMQQRFLVALATLANPKLIVLDEPTSALDPIISAEVLRWIFSLSEEKDCAILMVTHDLALARQFAQTIMVIDQGRLVETGSTQSVFHQPTHPITQELVAHSHWEAAPC